MKNFINLLKSNSLSYKIRNLLKFKPNIYLTPNIKNSSVSDFFYWRNDQEYETQFALMNIGSHILPKLKQNDFVNVFIYRDDGKFIKNLNFELNDLESTKINFDNFNIKGQGSFFIFHNLKNKDFLNSNNTFITERGYVGYRKNNNLWNYMHGNHNAAYLGPNKKIKSLMPLSLFYNEYIPQTRFDDVKKFNLIFNNVNKSVIKFKIEIFNKKYVSINQLFYTCRSLNTLVIPFDNPFLDIKFLKIKSNLLFCRPIIFKEYKDDFDIIHG